MAQHLISGTISDEQQTPIPFARIYVKNDPELRTLTNASGYYELRLMPGEYYVIIAADGYEQRETYVAISESPVKRDLQLFPSKINELEKVEIVVNKSNPGREIMLNVVRIRDKISLWNYPHTVDVYLKATEKLDVSDKKNKKEQQAIINDVNATADPFETKTNKNITENMNLIEVQLSRSFSPPNRVKETRNAFEKRGNDQNLYYTTTVKSNFNFFQNLLHLDDLHQSPVSSPISGPGILSYKYRLEEQYMEGNLKIDKIKIIPRTTATSTLQGYIWVIDSLWLVQKIELTLNKGNLLKYDHFTIRQFFDHPGDSICLLVRQELDYGVKFKNEKSRCNTIADFSNYNFNVAFSPKYFGNEVSSTEVEAYNKDSTYWNQTRKVNLTPEEKTFIIAKDSIRDAHNRKEYLDSVDALFNKITLLKILWFGIEHRNRTAKTQWTFSSISAMARPIYIAGPRVAPSVYYFKKWTNERFLDAYAEVSLGMLNKDVKGHTNCRYRYDPFHFGTFSFSFAYDFDAIRGYDAITQIYKRDNFIEVTNGSIGNSYELFNGFYLNTTLSYAERRSLKGYTFFNGLDKSIPNNKPTDFKTYQALLGELTLNYTPQQKYMREAHRKVLLGSRYPTFYLTYIRGIPKVFGSDVNHEYIRFGVMQTFKIGTLGTSSYHILSGKFLSSKNLYAADFKYPRRSDPIWFSNPLFSFQGLDSSLPSKDWYLEGHFVHHDNGAIVNKLPFMKKTGIGLVGGIGILYAKQYNWQHYELFAGLERNFKFSKRRLRIGIYGAVSDGNHITPKTGYKISFALLDDRNMKWNF
jgi:hypothetical protein